LSEQSSNSVVCKLNFTSPQSVYHFKLYSFAKRDHSINYPQEFKFPLSSITILDPVDNFHFHAESYTLSWNYPNSILLNRNLRHLVQFQIQIQATNNQQNESIYVSYPKSYKTLQLYKNTKYTFTIWSRINDGENQQWSKSSRLDVTTIEGKENRSRRYDSYILNLFYSSTCPTKNSSRCIYNSSR